MTSGLNAQPRKKNKKMQKVLDEIGTNSFLKNHKK